MTLRLAAPLLLILTVGCVRRDGRNSDCRWPGETPRQAATPSHLSADAEVAEDLAIRYADVHHGLRTPYYVSGEKYVAERDRCMQNLFTAVAKEHSVEASTVAALLGQNRGLIDLSENIPFALLYAAASLLAARAVFRRYPPAEDGWLASCIVLLFLSLAFVVGGVMLGDMWSSLLETWRVGNGHMSYRGVRLPWARYRMPIYTAAAVIFWLASAAGARKFLPPPSSRAH